MVETQLSSFKQVGVERFKGFKEQKEIQEKIIPTDIFEHAKRTTVKINIPSNKDVPDLLVKEIRNDTSNVIINFEGTN